MSVAVDGSGGLLNFPERICGKEGKQEVFLGQYDAQWSYATRSLFGIIKVNKINQKK